MKRLNLCLPVLALLPSLACTVLMRDPDYYHYDVMKALEPRQEGLKVCYDKVLENDDRAAGTVVAAFTVEKKTGTIKDVSIVPAKTTAPPALAQCATAQLEGVTIEAPDAQDAEAEYQWDFILNLDEDALVEQELVSPPEPGAAHEGAEVPKDESTQRPPAADTADADDQAAAQPETSEAPEAEPEAEVTFEIGE